MEIVEINTEFIKLDQLLKFAGLVGNGSDAKLIILDEMVCVNSEVCTMRGKKIRPGDVVSIEDGETLEVVSAK